jgi:hypothetical protein
MHESHHPHAQRIERLQKGEVMSQGITIFDAHVHDALAARGDGGGVLGTQSKLEVLVVLCNHLVDSHRGLERGVSGARLACRCSRSLGGVDGPKASVEAAAHHARIVDLREVVSKVVALHDVPSGTPEVDWSVEVCVERQELLVDRPGACARHKGFVQAATTRRERSDQGTGRKK